MDEAISKKVEEALNITLYADQKRYLLSPSNETFYWPGGRRTGKTLAHCIKLALSDGEPLDMRCPEHICDNDYGPESNRHNYARGFYRRVFLDVWKCLKDKGLKVREIKQSR